MRVLVIGLRGLPGVEGGVESHVEQLYSRMAGKGVDVEVAVRSHFQPPEADTNWQGLRLRRIWSPKTKGLEAFVHTFLAVCWGVVSRPDVLHIHAVGPGIYTPLARLLGLKVTFTHHGADYEREKWGPIAKRLLCLGESLACRFANETIAISKTIQNLVYEKYGKDARLIPNGVPRAKLRTAGVTLQQFGLEPHNYILQVSRLVPEKRQLDLIDAFEKCGLQDWKLVLTGMLKCDEPYVDSVVKRSREVENVVLTDFRGGEELAELFANAGVFVLPSTHEGLPIALLEALSYGLRVLASDIPANLEVGLDERQYFKLGDTDELANRLNCFAATPPSPHQAADIMAWVHEKYDWNQIAIDTHNVLEMAAGVSKVSPLY